MENKEDIQNDIREAQHETLRQTVAMCANLSHDTTLLILNYILDSSADTPTKEIAENTGLSPRTVSRHLKRLKTHPLTRKLFTYAYTCDTPEYNNIIYNINNNKTNNKSNKINNNTKRIIVS